MKNLALIFCMLFLASSASAQDKKANGMRGAKPPDPPVPMIVVGANQLAEGLVEPGWPIIVSAAVLPVDDQAPPAIPAGMKVKMTDSEGKEVAMTFERVATPPGAEEKLFWLANEAATRGLAPGRYRLTLVPDKGELAGWKVDSGSIMVVAPKPEQAELLSRLKIQRSLLQGKPDDALAEADARIAADVKNPDPLIAKGDILLARDQPDEALKLYNQARKLTKESKEESLQLEDRRRAAFERSLEKRGVIEADKEKP